MESLAMRQFAKDFTKWARDGALTSADITFRPTAKGTSALYWRSIASLQTPWGFAKAFMPRTVDVAISAFLCGIDQEILQLSFPASNGTTKDLTRTDGLVGWFAGIGWITRYAKERYVDTDPNPMSPEERKQLAMEPPDAGPELEEFGRILVEKVRDVAIRANDCLFEPNTSAPLALCWRQEAETCERDVFIRRVVLDMTDSTLALLLRAIDDGALRLLYRTPDGAYVDLREAGHGTLSEQYMNGPDAWRRVYSENRWRACYRAGDL